MNDKFRNFLSWKIAEIYVFGDVKYFQYLTRNFSDPENFTDSEKSELLEYIKFEINEGSGNFTLLLSHLFESGDFFSQDLAQAEQLLDRAVELGYPLASIKLALKYFESKETVSRKYTIEDLFEKVLSLAVLGDLFALSRLIKNGRFGRNYSDVLMRLLERGAKLGNPEFMRIYSKEILNGSFGKRNYKKAEELLESAISLGHAEAMFDMAECIKKGTLGEMDYDKAQKYYKKALEHGFLTAEGYLTNPIIEAVCAELVVLGIPESIKNTLKQLLIQLEEKSFELREEHRVNEDCYLSHFTSWSAIESILNLSDLKNVNLQRKNLLRQYHVDYMNDPSEGRRLLCYNSGGGCNPLSKAESASKILNEIFERNYFGKFSEQCVTTKLRPSIFMLSLTRESDRLDLWRAYGGDGNGYCIKLPYEQKDYWEGLQVQRSRQSSMLFYRELYGFTQTELNSILTQNIGSNDEDLQEVNGKSPTAYDVKYSNEDVEKTLLELSGHIDEIFSLRGNFGDAAWQRVEECICSILLELLYLYKDEQYSTEREARVLSVLNLKDERIKADERTPGHLYCETEPFLFTTPGSEVILGPKVEKKAAHLWNIRYRLTKLGFDGNTTVKESKVLYR
jgi:hypothetical protein